MGIDWKDQLVGRLDRHWREYARRPEGPSVSATYADTAPGHTKPCDVIRPR